MLQKCAIDLSRLAMFKECMENHGVKDQNDEWARNLIASDAVAYSCGLICRGGSSIGHQHDENEFQLCQAISQELADLMLDVETNYIAIGGDEKIANYFFPYYVVANVGADIPKSITENLIRSVFGAAIDPLATFTILPVERHLAEQLKWCKEDNEFWECESVEQSYVQAKLENMVDWFRNNEHLVASAYVQIGEFPRSDYDEKDREAVLRKWLKDRKRSIPNECNQVAKFHQTIISILEKPCWEEINAGGTILPILLVGITKKGSIVGVGSSIMHTW
jgi:hypothetical protein